MKRIAFILSFVLISLFSICNAQTCESKASAMARQFGYYAAFGDAVKASMVVSPNNDITPYVNRFKTEIDELGGIDKIIVESEEVMNENEMKVSLMFVCKKEDTAVHKTYILVKENNSWKIAMDKL